MDGPASSVGGIRRVGRGLWGLDRGYHQRNLHPKQIAAIPRYLAPGDGGGGGVYLFVLSFGEISCKGCWSISIEADATGIIVRGNPFHG